MTARTGRKGRVYGRLVVTSCRQPGLAPWVTPADTGLEDGRRAVGYAIRPPWLHMRRGSLALVVAWVGAQRIPDPYVLAHPVVAVRRRVHRNCIQPPMAAGAARAREWAQRQVGRPYDPRMRMPDGAVVEVRPRGITDVDPGWPPNEL